MATLIKNSGTGSAPECSEENKSIIDARIEEANTNIAGSGGIRDQILDLEATVAASTDAKIKQIRRATTFPIQDVFRMLAENPDAKYLRVYNGFQGGAFVTYMAPVNNTFYTFVAPDSSDLSIISKSCCHCNPCRFDKILNP
jgi:hypothetical protein